MILVYMASKTVKVDGSHLATAKHMGETIVLFITILFIFNIFTILSVEHLNNLICTCLNASLKTYTFTMLAKRIHYQ